ncbi:hypothetical protein LXL04_026303 [Taraxacum kok-saghyz]
MLVRGGALSFLGRHGDSLYYVPDMWEGVEQIEHLFWNCEVVVAIWDVVFKWLQLSSITIFHPGELFTWIEECRVSANWRKVIEAVVCTILWVIWRYRNDVVHDSEKIRKDMLLDSIKELSFLWFGNHFHKFNHLRFFTSTEEPWVRLMKFIYGRTGGFFSPIRPTVGGSPWLRILAAVHKLHRVNVVPDSSLRRMIGNGEDTRFWDDRWLGDSLLADRFPRLFALEGDRRCLVADRWDGEGWTWQWQRPLAGGRTFADFQALLRLLENVRCSQDRDSWVWNISTDGGFTVADTRRWIDDLVLPVGQVNTRWCGLVPRKVNIFIWRLLLDQLPTRERLCGRVAANVWGGIARWLQLPDFHVMQPLEIFEWLESNRWRPNQKSQVEVVLCAVLWFIWRYRNDVLHETRKMRKCILIDSIKEFSFVWFSNRQKKVVVSWTDWLQHPLNAV